MPLTDIQVIKGVFSQISTGALVPAGSAGVTVLFASLLFEAALKPRAKFSPDSVARASPED